VIFVDSCVLIDVFENDPVWRLWSAQTLGQHIDKGLFVNAVVIAEIAPSFNDLTSLQAMLGRTRISISSISAQVAWLAALAHTHYRLNKGVQKKVLPDFFIGAHAEAHGWAIITRDRARFQTYFPKVRLITPDAE
jgi:predicted nucleic acid-binding protein